MKKVMSILLSIIMVFSAVPMMEITAFAATSGDFTYSVLSETDKTCRITDYAGSEAKLDIPAQLNGYKVISIGNYAFYTCTSLTSVTIPDSVTSINYGAFDNCTSLTSITIPNSVTTIGDDAFYCCSALTSITIPNSVTSIGKKAFYNCTSLTSITIPGSVTSVESSTFSGCTSLTSIKIPDSVTSIGGSAFSGCTSLTSITIPDSVTEIGSYAFQDCTSLTSITIPDSVTYIGFYAFQKCSALTSITIPNSVMGIEGGTFSDCTSLTSVTIPDSVTYISYDAFNNCTSLTSVTIPNSVTTIGDGAFQNCTSLTSITIPNSVTTIGDDAFYCCSSLTSITISDSVTYIGSSAFSNTAYYNDESNWENDVLYIGKYLIKAKSSVGGKYKIKNGTRLIADNAFYDCCSLADIAIPSSVTSIGKKAFYNCGSLTSVTIPDSVTHIGESAFRFCHSLTSITIPNSVTIIESRTFSGCNSLTSITIPDSVTYISNEAFYGTSLKTIYGVSSSDAERYAKEYSFAFIDISFGAAQSQSVQRNNIQLSVFDRDAFLEGEINFINANTASAKHKLSGVTLSVNGKSQSFDKIINLTSAQLGAQAVLSKTDYQNFVIPAAVTASWMESDDLSAHNIYMTKDKKNGKPYIAGVFGRESGSSVAYTDLQSESLTALKDKQYDILLTAELRGESVREYVISQDDAHRITSTDGRFSNKDLVSTFVSGKPLYAYVKTSSGKTSDTVKLNLDITNVSINENTFSLMSKDGQSITLDKDNPLVGGAKISMEGFKFPLGIEVEGNRFKISFGIDLFSIEKENDQLWGEKDGAKVWEFFKTNVSDITDSVESSTEKLKKFNNFYKTIAPNQSYNNKNKNFDVSFLGYAEGYIVDGKLVFTDSCGEITGKFSFQYTQQGTIWVIPVYAYVKAGAGLSVKAQEVRMLPDNDVPFDFGMTLKVEPELTIGGGIGVKGAVSGGLYGKGSLPIENDFSAKHTVVKINGEIGIEGEFFCFSGKKKIISGSATLWDKYYGTSNSIRRTANQILQYNSANTITFTQTEVMSRDYSENTSGWLGGFMTRLFRSRSAVAEGVTIKELQTSVFKNSETQLISLNNGKMVLAYIEDNAERDTYNRMRLVYSVYENGFWSTPKAVDDDGTNDASPALATDGKNVYIAWQDLSCKLTATDTDSIDTILKSSEICFAKLNTDTDKFENTVTLTENSVYDYSPRIAVENGNAAVYWINNNLNDLTVAGSNTIYRYTTASGKTEAVKQSLNYIVDIECAFVDGMDELSYSTDADGVLSTSEDVSVFTISNGSQKQISDSSLTDFDVAYGKLDGKNTLFYTNNYGVYYYRNGETKNVFSSARAINGDLQVLEKGAETYLMWSEVSDAGTELWLCNYSGGVWSEPVQITQAGALLHNVSAVCNNGTIYGVFDRTARSLINNEYIDGQTDLCSMTLTDYTDLEVDFSLIDESSFVAGESSNVSVYLKNNGTKDISSADITLRDTLGTEITVNKIVDLPSGAETVINLEYPVPVNFGETTLEVSASVPNEPEINTANNLSSEKIGLSNISVRGIRSESVGEYYIFTSVVTNNSLSPAENVEVKIYEDVGTEELLNIVHIGLLQPGESYSVQYVVEKSALNFDSENLCKVKFAASTDSAEKISADNISFYALCREATDILLGDLDGNGEIDDWDSVILDRYLAGWDVEIDTSAADMDESGDVDDWDSVLLARKLAGWDV